MVETAAPAWADTTFRAMGSRCRLLVDGGPPDLTQALIDRIRELEAVWTRFRPDSEISRLNSMTGYHVLVGLDTLRLIVHAEAAWRATDGWFDPLMLTELEAAGYDRTHLDLDTVPLDDPLPRPDSRPQEPRRSPMSRLEIDESLSAVTLPAGARFDPGGIGKGLAVDLVVDEAIGAGVTSILVDLGGDLRVHGPWFEPGTWPALVGHPHHTDRNLAELAIVGGALATSSRRRRRWRTTDGTEAHHLLDPHTGLPSDSDLQAVTVHAGSTWYAEAIAKAALLAGGTGGRELVEETNTAALFVAVDGTVETIGPLTIRRLEP